MRFYELRLLPNGAARPAMVSRTGVSTRHYISSESGVTSRDAKTGQGSHALGVTRYGTANDILYRGSIPPVALLHSCSSSGTLV